LRLKHNKLLPLLQQAEIDLFTIFFSPLAQFLFLCFLKKQNKKASLLIVMGFNILATPRHYFCFSNTFFSVCLFPFLLW